jgi:hypothetical protein
LLEVAEFWLAGPELIDRLVVTDAAILLAGGKRSYREFGQVGFVGLVDLIERKILFANDV